MRRSSTYRKIGRRAGDCADGTGAEGFCRLDEGRSAGDESTTIPCRRACSTRRGGCPVSAPKSRTAWPRRSRQSSRPSPEGALSSSGSAHEATFHCVQSPGLDDVSPPEHGAAAGFGEMDHRPIEPADCAGRGESSLGPSLRPCDRPVCERLRPQRPAAVAPSARSTGSRLSSWITAGA